ncbi:MAG: hypothetical protein AAF616_01615 [Bacteroidota bacterium]
MSKFLNLLSVILFLTSCQIEDENSPTPEDAYIKYYGQLTSYEAKEIQVIEEGGVPASLVVLAAKTTESDDQDFFLLRTNLDGIFRDSVSFGFNTFLDLDNDGFPDIDVNQDGDTTENDIVRGDDLPGSMAVLDDTLFVVGSTSISISAGDLSINDFTRLAIAKVPLAADWNTLTKQNIQVFTRASIPGNTDLELVGNDIVALNDGGLLLVGKKEKSAGGVVDSDSYIAKIPNSRFLRIFSFEKTFGVSGSGEDEEAVVVFEKPNGNFAVIGEGNTNSSLGENGGLNGRNIYYQELDPNGAVQVNSRYYGVDDPDNEEVYDEFVRSAISISGGVIVVGTSSTSQGQTFGFAISLDNNGGHLASETLPSVAFLSGESGLQTSFSGVARTNKNDFVIVGQYPGFAANNVMKSGEALFMRVDQSLAPVPGSESNFGLSGGNDAFVDAATLPDGGIVVVGNVDFGAGSKLISIAKLSADGRF